MTTVSFYVNAGQQAGYGHIVRCIGLADELKRRGCQCLFHGNDEATDYAICNDFSWTPDVCHSSVWIVDLAGGCPPELAERLHFSCSVLVFLNGVGYPDGDPGRLLADLVFYQGVTRRPYELGWHGFRGWWGAGIEWLIIRPEFAVPQVDLMEHTRPRIVVSGGGSDPKDITALALFSLDRMGFDVWAIVGPANQRSYEPHGRWTLFRDPPDLAYRLANADVAVVSYGMTAFECLCLGIPTVALSISPDHAASAALVQEQSGGALLSLGEVENVHPVDIRNAVDMMLADAPALSQKARDYVDGKGVYRVAEKILSTLEAK